MPGILLARLLRSPASFWMPSSDKLLDEFESPKAALVRLDPESKKLPVNDEPVIPNDPDMTLSEK